LTDATIVSPREQFYVNGLEIFGSAQKNSSRYSSSLTATIAAGIYSLSPRLRNIAADKKTIRNYEKDGETQNSTYSL